MIERRYPYWPEKTIDKIGAALDIPRDSEGSTPASITQSVSEAAWGALTDMEYHREVRIRLSNLKGNNLDESFGHGVCIRSLWNFNVPGDGLSIWKGGIIIDEDGKSYVLKCVSNWENTIGGIDYRFKEIPDGTLIYFYNTVEEKPPENAAKALKTHVPSVDFAGEHRNTVLRILKMFKGMPIDKLREIDPDSLVKLMKEEIAPGLHNSINYLYTKISGDILEKVDGVRTRVEEIVSLGYPADEESAHISALLHQEEFVFQTSRALDLCELRKFWLATAKKIRELSELLGHINQKIKRSEEIYRKRCAAAVDLRMPPSRQFVLDDYAEFRNTVSDKLIPLLRDIQKMAFLLMPVKVEPTSIKEHRKAHAKANSQDYFQAAQTFSSVGQN